MAIEKPTDRRQGVPLDQAVSDLLPTDDHAQVIAGIRDLLQQTIQTRTPIDKNKPFPASAANETAKLDGDKKLQYADGKFIFDQETLDTTQAQLSKGIHAGLTKAIAEGDEKTVRQVTWYLEDAEDEATRNDLQRIGEACRTKNADRVSDLLKSLDIKLPLRSMAERRMIKEQLMKELQRVPFIYVDGSGQELSFDQVDFILVQQDDGFKLMIGSKNDGGIVALRPSNHPQAYELDLLNSDKDSKRNCTNIPIKKQAEDEPLFSSIEIYKGEIDLSAEMLRQELEAEKKAKTRKYKPDPQVAKDEEPDIYTQPRYTRPTTYVSNS